MGWPKPGSGETFPSADPHGLGSEAWLGSSFW
jgi:hypothetical protein